MSSKATALPPAASYTARTRAKPVCRYGAACTRKNPRHFQDFEHPSASSSSAGYPGGAPPASTAPIRAAAAPHAKAASTTAAAKAPPPTASAYAAASPASPSAAAGPPAAASSAYHRPPPAASSPGPSSGGAGLSALAPPTPTAPPVGGVAAAAGAKAAASSAGAAKASFGQPSTATILRCKFGCGRASHKSATKSFDTCCRKCGICQGAGDHDSFCVGGAASAAPAPSTSSKGSVADSGRSEAAALITADLALELRRRAKACEERGDFESARLLLADSLAGLRSARSRCPQDSAAAKLLDRLLRALDEDAGGLSNDVATNETFEIEIDASLEKLIAELDAVASAAALKGTVAAFCRFGCKRPVCAGLKDGKPYDTCCRGCAVCKGTGRHDPTCKGGSAEPETQIEVYTEQLAKPEDIQDSIAEECKQALRTLSLDDTWPTALTLREVRRRYMREALKCHPDKGPEEEREERTDRFQRLAAAFSVLEAQLAMMLAETDQEGELQTNPTGPTPSMPPSTSLLALPPAPSAKAPSSSSSGPPPLAAPQRASTRSIFSCLALAPPEIAADTEEIRPGKEAPPALPKVEEDKETRWDVDLF